MPVMTNHFALLHLYICNLIALLIHVRAMVNEALDPSTIVSLTSSCSLATCFQHYDAPVIPCRHSAITCCSRVRTQAISLAFVLGTRCWTRMINGCPMSSPTSSAQRSHPTTIAVPTSSSSAGLQSSTGQAGQYFGLSIASIIFCQRSKSILQMEASSSSGSWLIVVLSIREVVIPMTVAFTDAPPNEELFTVKKWGVVNQSMACVCAFTKPPKKQIFF